MASYSSNSAMVKQSWVSTKLRSPSVAPAASSAWFHACSQPSNSVMSRLLIGRKSLTCWAARNTTDLFRPSADSTSQSTRAAAPSRSEEHTSELQSLMRISYAAFCLKKKKENHTPDHTAYTI